MQIPCRLRTRLKTPNNQQVTAFNSRKMIASASTERPETIQREGIIMKFFVDSADLDQIGYLNDIGLADGVTTNPSIIAKSGRDFKEVIAEIDKRNTNWSGFWKEAYNDGDNTNYLDAV